MTSTICAFEAIPLLFGTFAASHWQFVSWQCPRILRFSNLDHYPLDYIYWTNRPSFVARSFRIFQVLLYSISGPSASSKPDWLDIKKRGYHPIPPVVFSIHFLSSVLSWTGNPVFHQPLILKSIYHSSERLLEHYVYLYIYVLHFAAMDILDIVLTNL